MACIGLGSFNKYHSYILLVVICHLLCDYIEGFNEKEYYNRTEDESFIDFGSNFAYHPLFRNIFYFLGSLICGLIFFVLYRITEKNKEGEITLEKVNVMQKKLLGLDIGNYYISLILISFIYTISITLRTFLTSLEFDAGFWTLEILFVIYLSIKILKIKIGNHQKVTIFILACILFIVQVIGSILPNTYHDCNNEECKEKYITDNNIYILIIKKFGNCGYIFLILFLYIFDFILRDISWVWLKYLMDVRSIPLFKIWIFLGCIGCSLITIIFFFVSNFPCNVFENIIYINNSYNYDNYNGKEFDFQSQVCEVINHNNITKKLYIYYDDFNTFLSFYSKSSRKILEIFIVPIYLIVNCLINFSHAMILKHLDPIVMLVNNNFNYYISRLILYIKNNGSAEYLTLVQFILLESSEIIGIIAYLIYIEIIELKFCKFDYDLRITISERGQLDFDSLFNLDENDDDTISDTRKESQVSNYSNSSNNEFRNGTMMINSNNNGVELINNKQRFNSFN